MLIQTKGVKDVAEKETPQVEDDELLSPQAGGLGGCRALQAFLSRALPAGYAVLREAVLRFCL